MRLVLLQLVCAAALLGSAPARLRAQAIAAEPETRPEKPLFSDADAKTLETYRLDAGKLDRFEKAIRDLDAQAQRDEILKAELDHDEAKLDGIDRFVNTIETEKPKMAAILKEAGLTAREFVLTSFSVTMAMVYADLLRAQTTAFVPPFVPRANIAFVRNNEDRLTKLFESLNRE